MLSGWNDFLRKRWPAFLLLTVSAAVGLFVGPYLGNRGQQSVTATYRLIDQSIVPSIPKETIVFYSQSSCAASEEAKKWLMHHGVRYLEKPVDTSKQALAEAKQFGARRTPFMLVGRYQVEGFDPKTLKEFVLKEKLASNLER